MLLNLLGTSFFSLKCLGMVSTMCQASFRSLQAIYPYSFPMAKNCHVCVHGWQIIGSEAVAQNKYGRCVVKCRRMVRRQVMAVNQR